MSQKRTLDAFFSTTPKRPRTTVNQESNGIGEDESVPESHHIHYPFPIAGLPLSISKELPSLPARPGKEINNEPDLDLLYFEPYVPGYLARQLFDFLRSELPFYRVEYNIKRGGIETSVRTPRWTTVFGLDETSKFDKDGSVVDAKTGMKVLSDRRYDRYPRPIPKCLDGLRQSTEAATGCKFNFCLVNYYASGSDSISFHSDDERFLGQDPAIASFSLGARRDFLMKHKPATKPQETTASADTKTLKYPLNSGDMILMRGKTQSNWLHSIPKRSGKNQDDGGRINITFRRAMIRDGTENYYNYNVGSGPVYRWDKISRSMEVWKPTR
ncbi:DNA oxidative demethylase ALKBH2-like protein [Cladobotryum mycophilum]|uniref:DNA oxidative demethylase ALKBH2-like protein n=1 Tax=Cladobotryum mycophilum TaxID=491253 RepID=A0ABR0S615_9HYPO